jgi:prepilin-type N-terminal cleavage/methylation domain-containing protein
MKTRLTFRMLRNRAPRTGVCKTRLQGDRRGFTLLETLVAVTVFGIVVVTAITIFVTTSIAQKRAESKAKLISDARFSIDLIAQTVRLDHMDFTKLQTYRPAAGSEGIYLITTDSQGVVRHFRWYIPDLATGNHVIALCKRFPSDAVTKCLPALPSDPLPDSQYTAITSVNIDVGTFRVDTYPIFDPDTPRPTSQADCHNNNFNPQLGACTCSVVADCFEGQTCESGICQTPNFQPRATIIMGSTGGSTKPSERATLTMQTTVSSRIYLR